MREGYAVAPPQRDACLLLTTLCRAGTAELITEEISEKAYWLLPKELFLQPKEVRSRQEARVKRFTEQAYHWEVATSGRVVDVCVLGEHVVVLTNDPVSLHVYLPGHRHYVEVELGPHLRYSSVPNMTDFPFTLRLLPLPAMSAVLLYIPSFEVSLLSLSLSLLRLLSSSHTLHTSTLAH